MTDDGTRNAMPFLKLALEAGAADPQALEDALFAAGASSVTLVDAADHPVLEPAPGMTPLWPTVRVEALFDGATEPDQVLAQLAAALSVPLPPGRFSRLEDRVWEREWLKDFRPMRFGARLWVCPGGQRPPAAELEQQPTAPVIVELDPGLAFGTGTHATTALCLTWLDSLDLAGRTVIDYGCGSGILAVAALKLGAGQATGIDIDPQALLASRDNAERNGVLERLTLLPADTPPKRTADILIANILAEPLLSLASRFNDCVVPAGHLVLSGILAAQATAVAQCYAPWFDMQPPATQEGWVLLHGIRRPKV